MAANEMSYLRIWEKISVLNSPIRFYYEKSTKRLDAHRADRLPHWPVRGDSYVKHVSVCGNSR